MLLSVVFSWSACVTQSVSQSGGCSSGAPYGCPWVDNGNTGYVCVSDNVIYKYCQYSAFTGGYYSAVVCANSSEADSVYCKENPDASGCFTPKDTTTYGCRDEIEITKGGAVTYHVVYKFTGKTTQGGGVEWTNYEEKYERKEEKER